MSWYYGFKPYVPVSKRRANAQQEVAKRLKKGETILPVRIEGRTISSTFWGKAWCSNLESYSDYANRLPRGRSYVRNGSVVDLKIEKRRIKAFVSGSEMYTIEINLAELPNSQWVGLKQRCAGQIGSLVELLQGKLSKAVMEQVTDRAQGLFPKPKEIKMSCSCPDSAGLCKHLAAVMYGVGHRLDSSPELLFALRGVDHMELIEQAVPTSPVETGRGAPQIAAQDLGAIFGIEIDQTPVGNIVAVASKPRSRKKAAMPKGLVKPVTAAAKKAKTLAAKKLTTRAAKAPSESLVAKKG